MSYALRVARPRVVIVGAGFGGLQCAKALRGKPVDVTLIDRNNYHLFTPLLYQVASSLLNPSDIARPVRAIFRGTGNVRFRQGEVTGIDFDGRTIRTADGEAIGYDFLVLAAGSTTNYFGMADVEERALGLKDLPEALELRNHILGCLERAAATTGDEQRACLTCVVVGGGPTGVEYAGALSELARLVLPEEYPELTGNALRVVLIEGLDEVLPPFAPKLGRAARQELHRKGIEVRTGVRVTGADSARLALSDGSSIEARTLVWAAGVRPSPLAAIAGGEHSRSGRLVVDEQLRTRGREREFAIGDIASFEQDGKEVPMLSAPAMQQGRLAAANIVRAIEGRPLQPFRYRDRGSMATIGKNDAVAELGMLKLTGFAGWLLWLTVHLYYLIGFRNKVLVLFGWALNYVRSDRPVRIIARASGPPDGDAGREPPGSRD